MYSTEVSIPNCTPHVHMYCLDQEVVKQNARKTVPNATVKINDNQTSKGDKIRKYNMANSLTAVAS
jgi:hypothetical protein